MRTEAEIRSAIATLERVLEMGKHPIRDAAILAGHVAALRYVIGEEQVTPTLAETLIRAETLFAEIDATSQAGA